jgi:uncharacterized protein YjbI with pentapeptide repeats
LFFQKILLKSGKLNHKNTSYLKTKQAVSILTDYISRCGILYHKHQFLACEILAHLKLHPSNQSIFNQLNYNFDKVSFSQLDVTRCRVHELYHGQLKGKNLQFADLGGIHLATLDFSNARLVSVKFNHSILENVNFSGADLQDADFKEAVLKNVDLRGANLTGAKNLKLTDTIIYNEKNHLAQWRSYHLPKNVNFRT